MQCSKNQSGWCLGCYSKEGWKGTNNTDIPVVGGAPVFQTLLAALQATRPISPHT